jgi:hypothetical protein
MVERAEAEARSDPSAGGSVARSARLGAIAGAIGIGCCLYPVVLVLVGLSTASAALDLGNRLFAEWGWAFKLSGLVFAAGALWVQRRRARTCPADARPRLGRNAAVIAVVALLTYLTLYGVTTWLGQRAG